MLLAHRREADAAIAEQDRRDAMPRRRRQHRVPGRLAVVMGVDIDPAGRDQQAVRVDLALRRPGLAADRGDPAAIDRNVAGKGFAPGAVDDGAAANDDVVHGFRPEHAVAALRAACARDRASAIGGATRRERVAMPSVQIQRLTPHPKINDDLIVTVQIKLRVIEDRPGRRCDLLPFPKAR